MSETPGQTRETWQRARFDASSAAGFYESYFQRANHPTRPLAFWIRYTLFAPRAQQESTRGQLWAIFFDGEQQTISVVKQEHPWAACAFSREAFDVHIADATLGPGALSGAAANGGQRIAWSLTYAGSDAPLLLLPERLYAGAFPKAKVVVPMPHALYRGELDVNGRRIDIDGWVGSQNHNWGTRHTDHYAWGQVAGFDEDPHAFLECSTARVRIGPWFSPFFTLVVLRAFGQQYVASSLPTALRARGRFDDFDWRFETAVRGAKISGRIHAAPEAFVGLSYENPPGGHKICLNSKLASAALTITHADGRAQTLSTKHRAAFELLSDAGDERVAIRV